jgi:condensin complex subunit 2
MPGAVVFINDDKEERRQRRLESHMRNAMSPGSAAKPQNNSRGGTSGLSSLSNVQIAEHYADCIKLSSENKINSKNAFGLHLIDYMLEMLLERGELENFQVAGCTLDAGAKIYASRVDSIYADAYKVLGGIGKNDPVEQGPHAEPTHTKERTKKEPSIATIEGNVKALNVSNKDLDLEVEPFLKQMSATLDERQEDGLMLCQLLTREDYSLVLDKQCDCVDVVPVYSDSLELPFKGITCAMDTYEICPSFSSFTITDDNQNLVHFVNADALTCAGSSVEYTDPQPDYSMLPYPTIPADSDCDEDPIAQDSATTVTEDLEVDNVHSLEAGVIGVCGDNNFAHILDSRGFHSGNQHHGLLTSAVVQSDYSYFDPSTFSTWAGIQHWKMRLHPKNEDKGRKSAPSKQRKPPLKVSFDETPCKKSFQLCKTLTNRNVDGALVCTTLPEDLHVTINVLLELFIHSQWKVEKQKPFVMVEDELDESLYGYGKGCDSDGDSSLSIQVSDGTVSQSLEVEETEVSHFELVALPKKVRLFD